MKSRRRTAGVPLFITDQHGMQATAFTFRGGIPCVGRVAARRRGKHPDPHERRLRLPPSYEPRRCCTAVGIVPRSCRLIEAFSERPGVRYDRGNHNGLTVIVRGRMSSTSLPRIAAGNPHRGTVGQSSKHPSKWTSASTRLCRSALMTPQSGQPSRSQATADIALIIGLQLSGEDDGWDILACSMMARVCISRYNRRSPPSIPLEVSVMVGMEPSVQCHMACHPVGPSNLEDNYARDDARDAHRTLESRLAM
jgi:hypothetical protein